MLFDLKSSRLNFRLSQVKLAQESGVSLPTIQNIEAGKANPTLEVLEKLLKAFGLRFQVFIPPFDLERASAFGVPLLTESSRSDIVINPGALKIETRQWLHYLREKNISEREKTALVAFLKGLKEHYPSFYEDEISTPFFDQIIRQYSRDGRVIKLRRIALAKMSEYL